MAPKQDAALMSCLDFHIMFKLAFRAYYSVWFIIKERSACVECTYSAALQKDKSNNNLDSLLCQSF